MGIEPITRKEMFMAAAAGESVETPTPITREEYFLSKIGGSGGGLTTAQINALHSMFKVCAFTKDDISAEYTAFKSAFGITDSEDYAFGTIWNDNSFVIVAANLCTDDGSTQLVSSNVTQHAYTCTPVFAKDTTVEITVVPDVNVWNQSFIGCAIVDDWTNVVQNNSSDVYLHYAVKTNSQMLVDTEYKYTYSVKAGYQLVMTFGGSNTTVPTIEVVS